MQLSDTKYRDIVLIGGGHAHALVVKMWGMRPLPGVRLTLISNAVDTPYSGMLPGLISGEYRIEETHIDLFKLCSWAGVRFICAKVTQLNCQQKSISLQQRPAIEYDIVSINTGSTPDIAETAGAAEYACAVKPISQFYQQWQQLLVRMQQADQPLQIAMVGAGAGGFELICAMHSAWQKNQSAEQQAHKFHWVVAGKRILSGHNERVQKQAIDYCQKMHIDIHYEFKVEKVTLDSIISKATVNTTSSKTLRTDMVIWCTGVSPAKWPGTAGLALDERGFIAVDDCLRSLSHPEVFAAGDVATQVASPRPKAGVFAVRQAPVLFDNLCRAILQRPLKKHRPQQHFLSLLATGNQQAIASRGPWCISGHFIWRIKDHIDRTFMRKLNVLPERPSMKIQACSPVLLDKDHQHDTMRCGGCGAKIASSILSNTLKKVTTDLPLYARDDIIIGLESPDDAAIISTAGKALAQSVDQFRSIIDDPYLFAKIATNHALSDLHAMACDPQSALSMVAMPFAGSQIQKRELYQLSYGIIETLNQAQCTLIGGHTSEATELSLGLTVNGLVDIQTLKTKTGISAGQRLILTKPIGTGVIMAAHMQAIAPGAIVQQCLHNMLQSNRDAATILKRYQVSAMTDLTGFGLIGHLLEMLRDSSLECHINIAAIPLLMGASDLSRQGIASSLYTKNLEASVAIANIEHWQQHPVYPLLFDPQTSGGLLAWVNADVVEQCLSQLQAEGYHSAAVIAQALETGEDFTEKKIVLG